MERYAGGEEIKEGIDGELIAQVMHHTFNCARLRNYLYSEQVLMNYGQRTIRLEKEHASRPVKRVVAFERFLRNISFCSGLDVCVHDYRSNMTLLNGKALMSPDMYKDGCSACRFEHLSGDRFSRTRAADNLLRPEPAPGGSDNFNRETYFIRRGHRVSERLRG